LKLRQLQDSSLISPSVADWASSSCSFEFLLEDLPKARNLDRFAYLAGCSRAECGSAEDEFASVKVAQLMGSLYEQLRLDRYEDEAASICLSGILFMMFCDDTALWETQLFEELMRTRAAEDGSDLGLQLAALFQVLDTSVEQRSSRDDGVAARFPYVNGHLFEKQLTIPYLDTVTRDVLLRCCAFNWASQHQSCRSRFDVPRSQEP
jgi:hypothetical protein